ncbi:hypothetical protein LHJ74_23880 [Streptomyces sp. N2-109]|uniref:VCBS repeat-containing protein n=1 Tax=Streptomyces gossypii TaxID=2883101 RepID=A0ABT2K057_9ACTN|nr:hypothetical protein [Streptomyces gossypii]MCT2592915.1 hypothetical protein [Streptomyces gossypii]
MTSRTALAAFAVCAVLVPLPACGSDGTGREPSPSKGGTSAAAPVPSAPAESREPDQGKGSKDPDDFNGDGHHDLLVPVPVSDDPDAVIRDERTGIVYGSAEGLDPSKRTVHGRRDLGLPEPVREGRGRDYVLPKEVETADLDGDGFPDSVTSVILGERATDGQTSTLREAP